jgi:hypothetical protein
MRGNRCVYKTDADAVLPGKQQTLAVTAAHIRFTNTVRRFYSPSFKASDIALMSGLGVRRVMIGAIHHPF